MSTWSDHSPENPAKDVAWLEPCKLNRWFRTFAVCGRFGFSPSLAICPHVILDLTRTHCQIALCGSSVILPGARVQQLDWCVTALVHFWSSSISPDWTFHIRYGIWEIELPAIEHFFTFNTIRAQYPVINNVRRNGQYPACLSTAAHVRMRRLFLLASFEFVLLRLDSVQYTWRKLNVTDKLSLKVQFSSAEKRWPATRGVPLLPRRIGLVSSACPIKWLYHPG